MAPPSRLPAPLQNFSSIPTRASTLRLVACRTVGLQQTVDPRAHDRTIALRTR